MPSARYSVIDDTPQHLVIQDDGPWDKYLTITNAAEQVVEELSVRLAGRRLFYIDSLGQLDELKVDSGAFSGFAPGPADLKKQYEAGS